MVLSSMLLLVVVAGAQDTLSKALGTSEPVLQLPESNGRPFGSPRIIGGADVPDGKFLYTAAVLADGTTVCGGVFLSREWTLTSAQCVVGFSSWEVWLGTSDLRGGQDGRVTIVSTSATVHPDYGNRNYDLAVINTLVVESIRYAGVNLPSRSDTPLSHVGDFAMMTGWGATVAGGDNSPTMKHANGTFAGECGAGYHVCLYTYNQVNVAPGDYGGPLMVYDEGGKIWKLMGVAIGTDLSGNRSVFTNVHQNLDWISSVANLPIND